MKAETEKSSLPVNLMKKGVFVGISFVSMRKGMKKRRPSEELEAEFRELDDYALPKEVRREIGAMASRKMYIFHEYGISVPSMKGHYIPNSNLPKFLEAAMKLQEELKSRVVEMIISKKEEINRRLKEFQDRYAEGEPARILPEDDEIIRREFSKFSLRINSITIATSKLLESMPELKEKVKEELLEQVNKQAVELENRVKKEIAADLKRKVGSFLNRLAELKMKMDDKDKPIHTNSIKGLVEEMSRLSALTTVDQELSSLMSAVKGYAQAIVSESSDKQVKSDRKKSKRPPIRKEVPEIEGANPEYVEAFRSFAEELKKEKRESPAARKRPETFLLNDGENEKLLTALNSAVRMTDA
jgi:hypothetical protein